jgi:hypothetical protein
MRDMPADRSRTAISFGAPLTVDRLPATLGDMLLKRGAVGSETELASK